MSLKYDKKFKITKKAVTFLCNPKMKYRFYLSYACLLFYILFKNKYIIFESLESCISKILLIEY